MSRLSVWGEFVPTSQGNALSRQCKGPRRRGWAEQAYQNVRNHQSYTFRIIAAMISRVSGTLPACDRPRSWERCVRAVDDVGRNGPGRVGGEGDEDGQRRQGSMGEQVAAGGRSEDEQDVRPSGSRLADRIGRRADG